MSVDDKKAADQPSGGWSVLEYSLGIVAAILLLGLAALTCVDVIARYWFNSPVNGAFELTQMMLAGLIFAALPMTTAKGEHVDVDLFAAATGKTAALFFQLIAGAISVLVLSALSWRLWVHAARMAEYGAVTNSLALPFAPIGYFAAVSCALSGVIAAIRLVNFWRAR